MKQTLTSWALAALPIVALCPACTTQGMHAGDHWTQRSITSSMTRSFTGYDQSRHGTYLEFQAENKKDVSTIFRRYFFHHNPENPFEVYDASYYAPRYPNSILPDTVSYLQDPIASVFGTLSEGGGEEFSEGLAMTVGAHPPPESKSASYMRSSIGVENGHTTSTGQ